MGCQSLVQGLDEVAQDFSDDVTVLSVVVQGVYGEDATAEDAGTWIRWFEITSSVVLADVDGGFYASWGPSAKIPVTAVVDRDGVVLWMSTGGRQVIDGIRRRLDEELDKGDPAAEVK